MIDEPPLPPQENGDHALMVPSPEPGDWFMFAFVNERVYHDYVQKVSSPQSTNNYHRSFTDTTLY